MDSPRIAGATSALRNCLAVTAALAESGRRPGIRVNAAEGILEWSCPVTREGDAWRASEMMADRFPAAAARVTSEPDWTFTVAVTLGSISEEWPARGNPRLPE